MTDTFGLLIFAAYEHNLEHDGDRTRALLALTKYALELDIAEIVFPSMLRFAANYSTGEHTLLTAARDSLPVLVDALNSVGPREFDEAMFAAYDDEAHTMPRGWMCRLLHELEAVLVP